jgi:hypothetical protein
MPVEPFGITMLLMLLVAAMVRALLHTGMVEILTKSRHH